MGAMLQAVLMFGLGPATAVAATVFSVIPTTVANHAGILKFHARTRTY